MESTYEGSYKNGIREGKGKLILADGSIKSGTFINGQLTGRGSFEAPNGNYYEGNFINGIIHGKGVFRHANGTTFDGWFIDGNPYTGKLTYYTGDMIYLQKGEPIEMISEEKSNYTPKIGTRQTEYFDENWNRCESKNAAYYRLITYSAPNNRKVL